jgi:hypothetical protein
MKEPRLIDLAQQGDDRAIAILLNRALAHKQLTVTVRRVETNLDIRLESLSSCRPDIILILCDRALLKMHLPIQKVRITASDWQEIFRVGDYANQRPKLSPKPSIQPSKAPPSSPFSFGKFWLDFPVESFDTETVKTLAAGLFLAILLISFAQTHFIFSYLPTIIHEFGHAVAGWLFGYPSIPSFDFMFGGGITWHIERWPVLIILVYTAIAWGLYTYRHNSVTLKVIATITLLYTILALSNWHDCLILFMGHGGELIFAGIFGYRAMSGFGCRYEVERLLYAMLAFFTVLTNLELAWLLVFNAERRSLYEEGKGGLLDNDFVRIANEYFGVDLTVVMIFFALICILTIVLTWGVYRYRRLWHYWVLRLLEKDFSIGR